MQMAMPLMRGRRGSWWNVGIDKDLHRERIEEIQTYHVLD
jgi:hypothetical protein